MGGSYFLGRLGGKVWGDESQVFGRSVPERAPKTAKAIPLEVERRVFEETKITAYRLKRAA